MNRATAATHPADVDGGPDGRLRRLRWAIRAVLTLGVTASVAANVLHALPNLISQLIAAWPPLALLLTVELISRVPTHRRDLAALRLLSTVTIAGIAAWVSYWHMAGVAARYGETGAAASYLLPLSVDGLVVVASISLVEIGGRLQVPPSHMCQPHQPEPGRLTSAQSSVVLDLAFARRTGEPRRNRGSGPQTVSTPRVAPPAAEPAQTPRLQGGGLSAAVPAMNQPARTDGSVAGPPHATIASSRPDNRRPAATSAGPRQSRTAAAVADWHQRDPALHPAEIAQRIGRSERTVRRHWPPQTVPEHSRSPSLQS